MSPIIIYEKYGIMELWNNGIYDDGRADKHKRMVPSDATSYLTTKGKSFSK